MSSLLRSIVQLYKIIVNEFEITNGKKSLNVRIPSFILDGDKNLQKYFFLGLYITDGRLDSRKNVIFNCASKNLMGDMQNLVKNVWGFNKTIYKYMQREKFTCYRIILNRVQSSVILSELPGSHNLVVRRS